MYLQPLGTLALAALGALLALFQPPLPAPRGFVNDFAEVIPAEREARVERIARDVRAKSRGEIAVVTLSDLAGRPVEETALRLLREWGVGARADIGDRARNAGAVVLVVPKETNADGRGTPAPESALPTNPAQRPAPPPAAKPGQSQPGPSRHGPSRPGLSRPGPSGDS